MCLEKSEESEDEKDAIDSLLGDRDKQAIQLVRDHVTPEFREELASQLSMLEYYWDGEVEDFRDGLCDLDRFLLDNLPKELLDEFSWFDDDGERRFYTGRLVYSLILS